MLSVVGASLLVTFLLAASWNFMKHGPGHRLMLQVWHPFLVVFIRPDLVTPSLCRHHLHLFGYKPGIFEET